MLFRSGRPGLSLLLLPLPEKPWLVIKLPASRALPCSVIVTANTQKLLQRNREQERESERDIEKESTVMVKGIGSDRHFVFAKFGASVVVVLIVVVFKFFDDYWVSDQMHFKSKFTSLQNPTFHSFWALVYNDQPTFSSCR